MKKLFLAVAMMAFAVAANAQSKGDMAVGANLGFAATDGYNNLGLGAKFQYNVTDPIRLEAGFNYFFPNENLGVKVNYWDFMLNAHWIFPVGRNVNLYPIAGLGVIGTKGKGSLIGLGKFKSTDSAFAFNLGGGADFLLSENLFLNAELKYLVNDGGFFMPAVGVGYKF